MVDRLSNISSSNWSQTIAKNVSHSPLQSNGLSVRVMMIGLIVLSACIYYFISKRQQKQSTTSKATLDYAQQKKTVDCAQKTIQSQNGSANPQPTSSAATSKIPTLVSSSSTSASPILPPPSPLANTLLQTSSPAS